MKGKGILSLLLMVLLASLVVVSGCIPGATDGSDGTTEGFNWQWLVIIAVFIAIFYFLLIRPQQKRQKQIQQMTQDLKRGDKVVTIGGIWGEIESISEDSIVLKIESGGTVRMAKNSIAGRREEEKPRF